MSRIIALGAILALVVVVALAAVSAEAQPKPYPAYLPAVYGGGSGVAYAPTPGAATATTVPAQQYVWANLTDPNDGSVDNQRIEIRGAVVFRRVYTLLDTTSGGVTVKAFCLVPSASNSPLGWLYRREWDAGVAAWRYYPEPDPVLGSIYQNLEELPGQNPVPPTVCPTCPPSGNTPTNTPVSPTIPPTPIIQPTVVSSPTPTPGGGQPPVTVIRDVPFSSGQNIDWGDRDHWTVVTVNNGSCQVVFVVQPSFNADIEYAGIMTGTATILDGTRDNIVAWTTQKYPGQQMVWVGDLPIPSGLNSPNGQCGFTIAVTRYTGTTILTPGTVWNSSQFTAANRFCAAANGVSYLQSWKVGDAKTVFQVVLENGACVTSNVPLQGSLWTPIGGDRTLVLSRIDQMVSEVIERDSPTTVNKTWLGCGTPLAGWSSTLPPGWTSTSPACP